MHVARNLEGAGAASDGSELLCEFGAPAPSRLPPEPIATAGTIAEFRNEERRAGSE